MNVKRKLPRYDFITNISYCIIIYYSLREMENGKPRLTENFQNMTS
jgi:hypothetical protein